MQLRLIFQKTVNKNKLKVQKFQSYGLSSFSTIRKIVIGVKVGGGNLVLFFSLILSVHIYFQYK